MDPRPPLEGRPDLPWARDWQKRRLYPIKELLGLAHRAVDPRGHRRLLQRVRLGPQQVHLVLQLGRAAVLQDVTHLKAVGLSEKINQKDLTE